MTDIKPVRSPTTRLRQFIWLVVAIVAILHFVRGGVDLFSMTFAATLIAFGFAAQYVETHMRRPRQNYFRATLASTFLALVLVAMPLLIGKGLWVGLTLWAGMSIIGLVWVYFYERTEPV